MERPLCILSRLPPTPRQPARAEHSTLRPATSREQMRALQAEWGKWWQVSHRHPALEWPPELGAPPPPPTVDQLKRVQ
eukprot:2116786-Pyramimonas_sp.AAC.1